MAGFCIGSSAALKVLLCHAINTTTDYRQVRLVSTGEMLELAVQMSVQTHDQAAFERNNQQLRQHYMESRQVLPPSQNEAVLTGLNLLRLLVQNRIAEFHTELEVIPSEVWSLMMRTMPAGRSSPRCSCFAGQRHMHTMRAAPDCRCSSRTAYATSSSWSSGSWRAPITRCWLPATLHLVGAACSHFTPCPQAVII